MKNLISTLMYVLPLLILIISCGESEQKKEGGLDGHTMVNINSHQLKIYLPNHYKYIPIEVLHAFMKEQIEAKHQDLGKRLDKLEKENAFTSDYAFFMDSTNTQNVIGFEKGPHMPLTKPQAVQHISMRKGQLEDRWKQKGIMYRFIDSRFANGKNFQRVKIRYEVFFPKKPYFMTEYLISTDKKTVRITVKNVEDKDYQYLIDKIQI